MTDWDFTNHERKRLGVKLNWKSVTAGDVHNDFTVLTSGRGKESVEAKCKCGNVSKYTAASLVGGGRKGGVRRCVGCDDRINAALAWKPPVKWRNPKPRSKTDREKARIEAESRASVAVPKRDRYG